jgi:hypothetical protein
MLGRASFAALLVATGLSLLVIVGFRGWIEAADSVETEVFAVAGTGGFVGIAAALINASKEKFGMTLWSLISPIVGVIGALRLGKPNSLWAKVFYKDGQKQRSEERYAGDRGKPFWKRGGELLRRLRLRRPAGA